MGDREGFSLVSPEVEARLHAPGVVPPYDERAHGTPKDWNEAASLTWNTKVRKLFSGSEGATVNVRKVIQFFALRPDAEGHAVSAKLGEPQWIEEGGWFYAPWKPFVEADLPTASLGQWNYGVADWQVAWHGSKLEALYSIMYHGRLYASRDAERGERFCKGAPGVYLHKEATRDKVDFYMRYTPFLRDGVFWAARWEARVDRSDRVVITDMGSSVALVF